MSHFDITAERDGRGRILVDGHDISEVTTGIKLDIRAGQFPVVTVDLYAAEGTSITGDGTVVVPERTAEALAALGWTAPGAGPVRDINTPEVRMAISNAVRHAPHCGKVYAILDRAAAGLPLADPLDDE